MKKDEIFIWHELDTIDQKKSGLVFNKLFGWTLKEVDAGEFGTYSIFQRDAEDIAGMMHPTSESPAKKSQWQTYIAVEAIVKL